MARPVHQQPPALGCCRSGPTPLRSVARQVARASEDQEVTMRDLIDSTLAPGGWVRHAQDVLDDLGEMSTLDEVARRFGTARQLCEEVLGFPVAGGHATKRVVRAVGRLLHHRLGPAVAAEALSWAASATEVVDTAAVEVLLESAESTPVACRPLRLEDRWELQQCLARIGPMAGRRRVLLAMFGDRPIRLLDPELADDWNHPSRHWDWLWAEWDLPWCKEDDLAAWLARLGQPGIVERVAAAETTARQIELVANASRLELEELARSELVFDLDQAIVARCLLEATAALLANPACPPGLSDRVRQPYDLATLELAIRAGDRHVDAQRLRRMLSRLDADAYLLARVPERFLDALRRCGLLSARDLTVGRLAAVDLSEKRMAAAAFGSPHAWTRLGVPDLLVAALRCHHQADELVWLLDWAPVGALAAEHARALIDKSSAVIARSALRHLPLAELSARDAAVAAACGGPWAAACPGLPACQRPVRTDFQVVYDRPDSAGTRYWYPPPVAALTAEPFDEAPGWTVELPKTPAEVEDNARVMRNCTAEFVDTIGDGSAYLVIVTDPQGRRYNVRVRRNGQRFVVDQVNSWANGGIEPAWIAPAFGCRLDRPYTISQDPPVPWRRPSDRRDRRRSRSRSARRLKR